MKRYKIIENNITYDVEEYDDGTKYWKLNGEFHREKGPTVEYNNSTKIWYLNGLFHREDGPTIEWADGSIEYYYNGNHLKHIKTYEDLKRYIKLLSIS